MDLEAIERHVRGILVAVGEDPDREGLQATPARVARAYGEMLAGYRQAPQEVLATTFAGEGYDEMVVLQGIEFYSMCEHHMLPFYGEAVVAYIPSQQVVGLSKLARLVEVYARRLQIQERMTLQIAEALKASLQPRGYGVVVRAKHLCMCARGVKKDGAMMVTTALGGLIRDDEKARLEFAHVARL